MILERVKPKTSGTRFKRLLNNSVQINVRNKFAGIKKKKNTGRSTFNGKTIKNRKSPKLKKNLNICRKLFLTKKLGVITCVDFFQKNKPNYGVIKFSNGAFIVSVLSSGSVPGDYIRSTMYPSFGKKMYKYKLGYTVMLYWLSKKYIFYNIHTSCKNKVILAKSAGTFSSFLDQELDKEYIKISLPSGEHKYVYSLTFVSLGRNSNISNKKHRLGKAGNNMKIGRKSSVRGVATNPVDHPNGGRTKAITPDKTPWGKIAKKKK